MAYRTPGVFVEEINRFPPSVAQVETAIPVFIGYTEKADDGREDPATPVAFRITSMLEYETYFGFSYKENIEVFVGPDNQVVSAALISGKPKGYRMYHALQMFFANGGGPCYIVSIGTYIENPQSNASGRAKMTFGSGKGGLDIAKKIDEITLVVFPDAHLLSAPQYYILCQEAISHAASLQDRFAILDLKINGAVNGSSVSNDPKLFFRNNIGTQSLQYAAAYHPWLNTVLTYDTQDENIVLRQADDGTGNPGDLHNKYLDDAQNGSHSDLITDAFLNDVKNAIGQIVVTLPPASTIAGIYASVDNARGVWKAPANVSLSAVSGPSEIISDQEQADYNVTTSGKSINVIRSFTGKGTLVWGARTLDGNDNEWRYISVRRFFNMVEESVKKATEQFVFDPNDANTWIKLKAMAENFLTLQWRAGALAGAKPEDAFFVKVGLGETMSSQDILEGRLIVEIGMAVVRPAEFIILRFMHKVQES